MKLPLFSALAVVFVAHRCDNTMATTTTSLPLRSSPPDDDPGSIIVGAAATASAATGGSGGDSKSGFNIDVVSDTDIVPNHHPAVRTLRSSTGGDGFIIADDITTKMDDKAIDIDDDNGDDDEDEDPSATVVSVIIGNTADDTEETSTVASFSSSSSSLSSRNLPVVSDKRGERGLKPAKGTKSPTKKTKKSKKNGNSDDNDEGCRRRRRRRAQTGSNLGIDDDCSSEDDEETTMSRDEFLTIMSALAIQSAPMTIVDQEVIPLFPGNIFLPGPDSDEISISDIMDRCGNAMATRSNDARIVLGCRILFSSANRFHPFAMGPLKPGVDLLNSRTNIGYDSTRSVTTIFKNKALAVMINERCFSYNRVNENSFDSLQYSNTTSYMLDLSESSFISGSADGTYAGVSANLAAEVGTTSTSSGSSTESYAYGENLFFSYIGLIDNRCLRSSPDPRLSNVIRDNNLVQEEYMSAWESLREPSRTDFSRDNFCSSGIATGNFCCPSTCPRGVCGGARCSGLECCTGSILSSGKICRLPEDTACRKTLGSIEEIFDDDFKLVADAGLYMPDTYQYGVEIIFKLTSRYTETTSSASNARAEAISAGLGYSNPTVMVDFRFESQEAVEQVRRDRDIEERIDVEIVARNGIRETSTSCFDFPGTQACTNELEEASLFIDQNLNNLRNPIDHASLISMDEFVRTVLGALPNGKAFPNGFEEAVNRYLTYQTCQVGFVTGFGTFPATTVPTAHVETRLGDGTLLSTEACFGSSTNSRPTGCRYQRKFLHYSEFNTPDSIDTGNGLHCGRRERGASCSRNQDCALNLCSRRNRCEFECGGPNSVFTSCPSDQFCVSRRCVPKLNTPARCTSNDQCVSNNCGGPARRCFNRRQRGEFCNSNNNCIRTCCLNIFSCGFNLNSCS